MILVSSTINLTAIVDSSVRTAVNKRATKLEQNMVIRIEKEVEAEVKENMGKEVEKEVREEMKRYKGKMDRNIQMEKLQRQIEQKQLREELNQLKNKVLLV